MKRIYTVSPAAAQGFKMKVMLAACAFTVALCFIPGARAFSQNAGVGSGLAAKGGAGATAKSEAVTPPKVGEAAPDFKLPYATLEKIFLKPEEHLSLSGFRGKNVVLAFYPADWSGGCTKEVCTLRDTFSELARLNAVVLGISGDYVFSHHEWAKFHKLQFPLLSDHDHRVARLYGSFNETVGYNKRTVFLVDKEGVVRYSNLEFKAGDAADYNRLREELTKLK
jgi:peroxiredoxin